MKSVMILVLLGIPLFPVQAEDSAVDELLALYREELKILELFTQENVPENALKRLADVQRRMAPLDEKFINLRADPKKRAALDNELEKKKEQFIQHRKERARVLSVLEKLPEIWPQIEKIIYPNAVK